MNRLLPKERAELEAAQSHLIRAEQSEAWYPGRRELLEAGRCLKALKHRTALAAIKFAARMTNRGERDR